MALHNYTILYYIMNILLVSSIIVLDYAAWYNTLKKMPSYLVCGEVKSIQESSQGFYEQHNRGPCFMFL